MEPKLERMLDTPVVEELIMDVPAWATDATADVKVSPAVCRTDDDPWATESISSARPDDIPVMRSPPPLSRISLKSSSALDESDNIARSDSWGGGFISWWRTSMSKAAKCGRGVRPTMADLRRSVDKLKEWLGKRTHSLFAVSTTNQSWLLGWHFDLGDVECSFRVGRSRNLIVLLSTRVGNNR